MQNNFLYLYPHRSHYYAPCHRQENGPVASPSPPSGNAGRGLGPGMGHTRCAVNTLTPPGHNFPSVSLLPRGSMCFFIKFTGARLVNRTT